MATLAIIATLVCADENELDDWHTKAEAFIAQSQMTGSSLEINDLTITITFPEQTSDTSRIP